jgi:hypothetical protein
MQDNKTPEIQKLRVAHGFRISQLSQIWFKEVYQVSGIFKINLHSL